MLIGGPGQGKTTLAQFLCQIFRASIISGPPLSPGNLLTRCLPRPRALWQQFKIIAILKVSTTWSFPVVPIGRKFQAELNEAFSPSTARCKVTYHGVIIAGNTQKGPF